MGITAFLYILLSWYVSRNTPETNDYLGAIEIKHRRLDAIDKPKIIFAGGSNLAFGIDSKKIEEAIEVPVVNLGLHAALGLKFILAELENNVKSGDVVVLSPEYFLDPDGQYEIKNLSKTLYPPAVNYYPRNIIEDIRAHLNRTRINLELLKSGKQNPLETVYSKKSFNTYGDVVAHLNIELPTSLNNEIKMQYHYWEGIKLINDFHKKMNKRNVKVMYLYPVIASKEFEINKEEIKLLNEDLIKDLNIKILGNLEDFVYKDDYFFDTVYHLNKEGRMRRSIAIIKLLKKTLMN